MSGARVGASSSSPVALVVTDYFSYLHLPTIGSVWSCSVMLGTRDPSEGADQILKYGKRPGWVFVFFLYNVARSGGNSE